MKDRLKHARHDSEEVYFHLKNQEALEKLRARKQNGTSTTPKSLPDTLPDNLPDNVIQLRQFQPRGQGTKNSTVAETEGRQKHKKAA